MRKHFKLAITFMVSTALLVGCGGGVKTNTDKADTKEPSQQTEESKVEAVEGDEKESVTISMTYATGDQLTSELMHDRIEGFMAENPHVTIEERLSNEGGYLDSIKTLDAVGEFPDIIEMRDTPMFVRADKLGKLPDEIVSLFSETVDFDGDVYTAPITEAMPNGIIYNKTIFNDLGIKVEDIKTYDDFLDVCEKIQATGVAPIVVGGSDIWHLGFWWGYFWQDEVSKENPDWLKDRYLDKVSFTDDNVKEAMERMTDLFKSGYIEKGWTSTAESQAPSILISEQAAMYYCGPFVFPQIEEADSSFEYGYFGLPSKDGSINIIGGPTVQGWAINAETQKNDPLKTQAVYDFMKYFYEKDTYTEFVQKMGAVPTLKEEIVYGGAEPIQEVLRLAREADDKQLNWNMKIGENEMPPNFRNFCYKLASEWFLGVSTVEEGLVSMEKEWENVTKDFNPMTNPQ